jgi:hypothetical protein
MSFLGKPVLSGTVVTWDGTKFVADTIINGGSLQDAYNNGYQIQITSSQPFTLTGSNSSSGPVFEIIHSSNQSTDEGIKFTTEATAPASDWKPIVVYDKNGLKVFEIETDTNNSIVSVRSPAADGNSGFQFLNQIGTYIALDAVSSPTILRIQKASDGYIDFAADGISEPVMRIFADTINGTISSSVYITSSLLVSGTIKANVISSSLTRLADGSPYLLAGDNITLVTNSIGQIEISSSANALPSEYWFSSGSNKIATTSSVAFLGLDYPTKNKTSDYGSDVFLFVSGSTGTNSGNKAIFGGTTFTSGNMQLPFDAKLQSRNSASNDFADLIQLGDGNGLGLQNNTVIFGDTDQTTGFAFLQLGGPAPVGLVALITGSNAGFFSGSYKFPQGLSGSLQMLTDGVTTFLTGTGGITITNLANGQIEISGTVSNGGGTVTTGSNLFRLGLVDYVSVNSTSPTTIGQVIFPANEFSGSLTLRGIVTATSSSVTGTLQLYNVTSGAYVDIGGPGITHISVTGTLPTIIESVNLINAVNFNTSSQAIYELIVSSSNNLYPCFFGGFELRPSGSFTGNTTTIITSSINYISGNWEDGGNKLATTSSIAIAGNFGSGYFAENAGNDVFFYVSGAVGLGNSPIAYPNSGQSVFGGNLFVSGNLIANGLNITPIVGNGFTNDTFTMTSLSGNIIYNTPSNSTIDATKLIHLDIIASSKDNSNLPVGFVATYTILIKKQNNTQTIEQAIEISRDIFGSGLSSNWDVNFDPDGTIGVTGSAGTSQNVFWIAEITRTRELNVSGTII